jgi:hypothetical protein
MAVVIRDAGVSGIFQFRVWGLLLLYNAMFIMPLLLALVLTNYGLSTATMLKLSRQNVVVGKALLGTLLLCLGVYFVVAVLRTIS